MTRLVAGLLLIGVCDSVLAHSAPRWTREKVVGLHFYIVDPIRIESYSCTKAGGVAVEIGTRHAIMPPLWYWRIRNGRLQFTDDSSVREDFTLLNMQSGLLTVRKRSGEVVQFHYEYERQKT